MSVGCLVSFDLLDVDEFDVIAEALFVVSSVWIATHFSVAASVVSTVVVLLVSVVLGHHFLNALNLTVTFVETVEDHTIATLAPLAFFSASVWLSSWLSFAKTLLSHVRGDIFAPESARAFDPSVRCFLSSEPEVGNGQERIGLWLWCLVDRGWGSTESSDPGIADASELSPVVSNVSWALSEILLNLVVLALWISLHFVASSVPVVSGSAPISSVSLNQVNVSVEVAFGLDVGKSIGSVSVSALVETPLHVVLVSILSLAHLDLSGPRDVREPLDVHLGLPSVQVSVSKLVSSLFDTEFSPVFLSSSPVSGAELSSEIRVSTEIPVALSSRHSSAESPSVDSKSIAPPCLWVAGSLDSPSLPGSPFHGLSDSSDLSNSSGDFLAFSDDSSPFTLEGVLVPISGSYSLATSHDPSPSPSPDPSARPGSSVPLISIPGSDAPAASSDPSPSPSPSEFPASLGSSSSLPVASVPEPLIPNSSAVDDSPFPGPLSSGDSSTSPFVVESIPDSLSTPGSPSPLPSSGSGLSSPPLVSDSHSLTTSSDPLPSPSPSSASTSASLDFSDDSSPLSFHLHELSSSQKSLSSNESHSDHFLSSQESSSDQPSSSDKSHSHSSLSSDHSSTHDNPSSHHSSSSHDSGSHHRSSFYDSSNSSGGSPLVGSTDDSSA